MIIAVISLNDLRRARSEMFSLLHCAPTESGFRDDETWRRAQRYNPNSVSRHLTCLLR